MLCWQENCRDYDVGAGVKAYSGAKIVENGTLVVVYKGFRLGIDGRRVKEAKVG